MATETKPLPKPKLVKYGKNCTELFSYVGVEPTFYPDIKLEYKLERLDEDLYATIMESLIEYLKDRKHFSDNKCWLETAHSDDGVLEISGGHEHKTLEPFVKTYTKLFNKLRSIGFYPSSVIDRNIEGGCHINFNVADKSEISVKTVNKFINNLICFLNTYPTLVWGYLAPEDNQSSEVTLNFKKDNNYEKGQCVNIRRIAEHISTDRNYNCVYIYIPKCIELRFFMMPRTIEEFIFHTLSADAILKYVWNCTLDEKKFSFKNTAASLKRYSYGKAIKELKIILPRIGISYGEFTKFNKPRMLKERFKFSKSLYLV